MSNVAPSCPRIAAYLEDSEKRFMDLRAPGGHTHWREVYSETIHLSCPQLSVPHLILPGLNQGLSLVSSPLPVPLLAVGKGKPPLFEKTRVTANQDRHRAKEEAAMANQIRMGPSSGVGTLGWPDRRRRGGLLLGEVEKNAAWHFTLRLNCPGGKIGSGALPGRTPTAIVLDAITQFRHSITVSTLFSKPTRAATGSP